jgi:hypothetical protein
MAYILDRFKPFGWKVPSSWREPAIVLLDVGASSSSNTVRVLLMVASSLHQRMLLCARHRGMHASVHAAGVP